MSPDDLATVDRSWAQLDGRRDQLLEHLETRFAATDAQRAVVRARWLVDAVSELVGLLSAPSRLGGRARALALTWPITGAAPSFGIEGRAWLHAVRCVDHCWNERTEDAWRQAWLLLSEVLAEQSLSPFAASELEGVQQ